MAFSFNFSGDDIDTSYDEVHEEAAAHVASAAPQTPQAEVKAHHLQELVGTGTFFYGFPIAAISHLLLCSGHKQLTVLLSVNSWCGKLDFLSLHGHFIHLL